MTYAIRRLQLTKLYPLAISRGVSSGSENLFLTLTDGPHWGIGECAPATGDEGAAARAEAQLLAFLEAGIEGQAIHDIWHRAHESGMDAPALAALDTALWDLEARRLGVPLYRMLGLPRRTVATSITIGINPPEVVRERVPDLLRRTGTQYLKIKLGNPAGIDADKESFLASKEAAAPFRAGLRVDANGGWGLDEALEMLPWLANHGVDYVEQPLPQGQEEELPVLYRSRPLPIFVDESCRLAADVPKVAPWVDGVNLKLMKTGGVTEALRLVATARAHGLSTMIGCMSEGSVGIAAGAHIAALFDHVDLDSHLNLNPDPAEGLLNEGGQILPTEAPGLGVRLRDA